MKKYIGMNFMRWCLENKDNKKLNILLHNYPYNMCTGQNLFFKENESVDAWQMVMLQNSVIEFIATDEKNWYISLGYYGL